MAEQIELAKFSFDVEDVVKSASQLKEALDIIKEEQKELKKSGDTNSTTFVENEAKMKALNAEYRKHISIMQTANKTKLDTVNRQQRLTQALNVEAVTIDQLRAKNKQLNTLRNSANITTAKGREELKLLNAELDKNNVQIKENVDAYTQQKINIGNYGSALQGVSPKLSMLVTQGQTMIKGLKGMQVALAGSSKGLKLFRIALISTGIGAIVVALGLMVGFFLKTQSAVDGLMGFLTPLRVIFQSIVGVLENLGGKLFKTFSDPKKAISDLADLIKQNLSNRIDGLIETFGILGDVIKKALSFDFEGASKAADGLGEALSKSATGIENFGQKLSKFGEDTAAFFAEAAERGKQINDLGIEAENQEIAIVGLRSENLRIVKEQELIAKNTLLTDRERKAALDLALEKTKEIETAELGLLDTKIKIMKLEQESNDISREELLELANLEAERDDKKTQGVTTALRFQGTQKKLATASAARAKKARSEAIKQQKELLDLYLAEQGTRAKTLEEQITISEEVSRRKIEILDAELAANKISQEKYDKELIDIENEQQGIKTELLINNAARELELYRTTADNKLEIDQFLSQAVLENKQAENDALLLKEQEFLALKLEQGVISQTEFNDAINLTNEENRLANEEIELERKEIEKEEKAEIDALAFEEQLVLMEEQGASTLEIQQQIDERNKANEVKKVNEAVISEELKEARIDAIDKKYKDIQKQREEIKKNNNIAIAQSLLSGVGALVDKQSVAGKAIALAQTGISTYKGMALAIANNPPPSPVGIIGAALVGALGIKSMIDIAKTKMPKADGSGGAVGGGGGGVTITPPSSGNLVGGVDSNTTDSATSTTVQDGVEQADSTRNAGSGVEDAVRRGAQQGTEQGANEGITNLSENRQVETESAF